MKVIRWLDKIITRFASVALIILSSVMIASAFLQVVTRLIFRNSFGWTDELCRYTMVWLALFAGGMAVKNESHVGVNIIRDKLPERVCEVLLRAIAAITFVFSSAMSYYGILLIKQTMRQLTTGLRLPMGLVYVCIPIGGVIMMFYSLLQALGLHKKL